jgi:hypothetical protein
MRFRNACALRYFYVLDWLMAFYFCSWLSPKKIVKIIHKFLNFTLPENIEIAGNYEDSFENLALMEISYTLKVEFG